MLNEVKKKSLVTLDCDQYHVLWIFSLKLLALIWQQDLLPKTDVLNDGTGSVACGGGGALFCGGGGDALSCCGGGDGGFSSLEQA